MIRFAKNLLARCYGPWVFTFSLLALVLIAG